MSIYYLFIPSSLVYILLLITPSPFTPSWPSPSLLITLPPHTHSPHSLSPLTLHPYSLSPSPHPPLLLPITLPPHTLSPLPPYFFTYTLQIKALIQCGKLKNAYLVAIKARLHEEVELIADVAAKANQLGVRDICEKWLQQHQSHHR